MCTYIYRHITVFMICRSSVLQNQTVMKLAKTEPLLPVEIQGSCKSLI